MTGTSSCSRRFLATAALSAASIVPAAAPAQTPVEDADTADERAEASRARAGTEDTDWGLFSFETPVTRWSGFPSLTMAGGDASRLLVGLRSPSTGPVTTVGLGGAFAFRANGWTVSLFHVRCSTALASAGGDEVANDAPVNVRMHPLHVLELGPPLGGIGVQAFTGAFKLGAAVEGGFSYAWATADLSDPFEGRTQAGMAAWSPYVRADLAACVRIRQGIRYDEEHDHLSWACLDVMPSLYDHGWLQAQAVGLRIDL